MNRVILCTVGYVRLGSGEGNPPTYPPPRRLRRLDPHIFGARQSAVGDPPLLVDKSNTAKKRKSGTIYMQQKPQLNCP